MNNKLLLLNALVQTSFYQKVFQLKRYYFPTSICLGAIASLAMAPFNYWILLLMSLSLLFTMQHFFVSKKQVFSSTLLFFCAYNFFNLDFINFVMQDFGNIPFIFSCLILIIFCLYLSLPYALLQILAFKLSKGKNNCFILLFTPVAFILADVIIYYLFTGFPWNFVGYSTISSPLKAYAPLVGVLGINLCIYIICGALSLAIQRQFFFLPIPAIIFAFGIIMMGSSFTHAGSSYHVNLVQGNINQKLHWNYLETENIIKKYLDLSIPYLRQENNITIWPESALPVYIQNVPNLINDLNSITYDHKSFLITGIQEIASDGTHAYNSIVTLGTNKSVKNLQIYHKSHLVPFGEFVPFEKLLRPLGKIFNFPMSSFIKGNAIQSNTQIKDLKLINAICYESIFSTIFLNNNHHDSGAILMLSNDSWFGDSRGPYMHLEISKMRTLELQKPMLRVTNNGITAIINEKGQVTKVLPRNQEGVIEDSFTSFIGLTPYAICGNIPVFVICLILCILGFYYRNKNDKMAQSIASLVRP